MDNYYLYNDFLDLYEKEEKYYFTNKNLKLKNITNNKSNPSILKEFFKGKIYHYKYLELSAVRQTILALHNRLYNKPFFNRFYIFPINNNDKPNHNLKDFNSINYEIGDFYLNSIQDYGKSFYTSLPELKLTHFKKPLKDEYKYLINKIKNYDQLDNYNFDEIELINSGQHLFSNFQYIENLINDYKKESIQNMNRVIEFNKSNPDSLDNSIIISSIQTMTFHYGLENTCVEMEKLYSYNEFIMDDFAYFITDEENISLLTDFINIIPSLYKCNILNEEHLSSIYNSFESPFMSDLIKETIKLKLRLLGEGETNDSLHYLFKNDSKFELLQNIDELVNEEEESHFLVLMPLYQLLYGEYLYSQHNLLSCDNIIDRFWYFDSKFDTQSYWKIQNYNEYFFRSFIIGSWHGGHLPLWKSKFYEILENEPYYYKDMDKIIGYYISEIISLVEVK